MAKRPDPLKHLPPDKVVIALLRLKDLPVNPKVKRVLAGMIEVAAAADPVEESLARVTSDRRANMTSTGQAVNSTFTAIHQRGRQGLQAMSDEEFDRLIEEANRE